MKTKTKKQPVKPIKALNVPLQPSPEDVKENAERPDVIPLILPGEAVKEYNEAAAQEKAWKQLKEDARPAVEDHALAALYIHNCANPENPVKTIALQDDTGSACNISLKDNYGAVDPAAVIKGIEALGKKDPNQFVAEKLVVGFDVAAFWDADGNFRTEFYMAMLAAINKVADEHKLPTPFTSGKVTVVRDEFGQARWKSFTAEQQPQVSALFPSTVSLTPVAPKKAKE